MQYLIFLLLFVSCGKPQLDKTEVISEPDDKPTLFIRTCHVETIEGGAEITCPDGSKSFISNGSQGAVGNTGAQGNQGAAGKNGVGCSVTQTETGATIDCGDTSANITNGQSIQGPQGETGATGEQGVAGQNGQNGYSIVMNVIEALPEQCANGGKVLMFAQDVDFDGVWETYDLNQVITTVCNGVDGERGNDGISKVQTITPIAACGNTVNFKEVLLCMPDGNILASFSENENGKNTRLSYIVPGTFRNSDGSNCIFTVSKNGAGVDVSWPGKTVSCQPQE